jgi:hypothetical protein
LRFSARPLFGQFLVGQRLALAFLRFPKLGRLVNLLDPDVPVLGGGVRACRCCSRRAGRPWSRCRAVASIGLSVASAYGRPLEMRGGAPPPPALSFCRRCPRIAPLPALQRFYGTLGRVAA